MHLKSRLTSGILLLLAASAICAPEAWGARDLTQCVFSGLSESYLANGRGVKPKPSIIHNGTVLHEGRDYTLSYENNYTGGDHDATIIATGGGLYSGTIRTTFRIKAVQLNDFQMNGDGSYRIATADDLGHLSAYVNGGNDCAGLTFRQVQDIIFPHDDAWDDANSTENNFFAIGTGTSFKGSYDGGYHTIKGLRIYKGEGSSENNYQGLFGIIGGGLIRGICLTDTRITGCSYVGGIAGDLIDGTVEDCSIGADVAIHSVLISCEGHGGVVGINHDPVRRCISRAKLTAANINACDGYGGIVGMMVSEVSYCLAIGVSVPKFTNDSREAGAIVGQFSSSSGLLYNYYFDCDREGETSNIGTGDGDNIGSSGAMPALSFTAGEGVTISAGTSVAGSNALGITGYKSDGIYRGWLRYNGANYCAPNVTLRLRLSHVDAPEGYDFGGYSCSGGGQITPNGSNYVLTVGTEPIIINNIWTPHNYTVIFYKNCDEATGTMDPQAFEYGTPQTLSPNAFQRPNHYFLRWNTAPDGSGTSYDDAVSVFNLTADNNASISLYAQWRESNYYDISVPSDPNGTISAAPFDHVGNTVTITATPAAGHRLTPGSLTVQYIDGESNLHTVPLTQDPDDLSKYYFTMPDGQVSVSASFQNLAWVALGEALAASSTDADNPSNIVLDQDCTAASGDSFLELPSGHYAIIDLNGHSIDRHLSEAVNNGYVIIARSTTTLTIRDSSPGQAGTITGGWSNNLCGGVVFSGTALRLESGNISGNKLEGQGGSAVSFVRNFYMSGGSISGNASNLSFGKYSLCGTVYANGAGNFYLSGGSISGNYCGTSKYGSAGFGSYTGMGDKQIHLSGSFTLSGNYQGRYEGGTWSELQPSDYLNDTRNLICIDAPISPAAPAVMILNELPGYALKFTSGWSEHMAGEDPETCFTLAPNVNDRPVGVDDDGELVISTPHGSTVVLRAHSATLGGQTRYWASFFDASISYVLPDGAQAFTMKADKALYRVGDGSVIPAGCAVIVVADRATLTLRQTSATATPEPGNMLIGTDSASNLNDVFVLSKVGDNFGFYKFSGTIPANKVYYVE